MKNKKTRIMVISAVMIIILIALSACSTITPAGDEDAIAVIELLNSEKKAELTAISADSFLLDAEILHGSALTKALWSGLIDAGFKLDSPVIIERRLPASEDKELFGNSIEVETYFTKYVAADSMLFIIGSETAEIALILSPAEDGSSMISAFGGPF